MLAIVLVSGLLVGAAHAAWVHSSKRPARDTAAFQHYVRQYIDGWASGGMRGVPQRDRRWAVAHPQAVLREGDRACDWLSKRPAVPDIDPTGSTGADWLRRLYVADTAQARIAQVAPFSRERIVTAAWNYLCLDESSDKTSAYYPDESDD